MDDKNHENNNFIGNNNGNNGNNILNMEFESDEEDNSAY